MCFSYTFEKGEKAASDLVGNVTALMPFLDADPCHVFPAGICSSIPTSTSTTRRAATPPTTAKIDALLEMESTIRAGRQPDHADEKLRASRIGAGRGDHQFTRLEGTRQEDRLHPGRHGGRAGRQRRGFLVRLVVGVPVRRIWMDGNWAAGSGKGGLLPLGRGPRDRRLCTVF